MELRGCFTAITTPFRDGAIDEEAMAAHASWLIDEGVQGIVVCGTTGEAATMSEPERLRAIQLMREVVADRAWLVAGAGNNSTSESLAFIDMLHASGTQVDAVMSVVPYYNKPNQDGLLGHFTAICDRSRFPVVLYNVPSRTVVGMTVDTMARLAAHPNVCAIKEASADLHLDARLLGALPRPVQVLSGDDATALPLMAIGGSGVISVIANIAPALMRQLCDGALGGDLPAAQRANRVVAELQSVLFAVSNPIPVKAACAWLGFGNGDVRLPLARMARAEEESLFERLTALGVRR